MLSMDRYGNTIMGALHGWERNVKGLNESKNALFKESHQSPSTRISIRHHFLQPNHAPGS